jgi:serine/threonine protein kinase
MAPEVIAGASGGEAGDIYGLAATLFYALTGKNPRDAGPGVAASALIATTPRDLDDVLCRALDADPGRRPASAADLASDLAGCTLAGAWAGGWSLEPEPARPAAVDGPGHDATFDADAPATRAEGPMARGVTGK